MLTRGERRADSFQEFYALLMDTAVENPGMNADDVAVLATERHPLVWARFLAARKAVAANAAD